MCDVRYCKQKDVEVTYCGHDVCLKHWTAHCRGDFDLKVEFQIKNEA